MKNHDPDPRFPERKHPRLKDYDYSQPGYYFVTICSHQMKCLFGEPNALNDFGRIAMQGLPLIEKHCPGLQVDKYVVMPNHVHAIIKVTPGAPALFVGIGQYKAYVTRTIRQTAPMAKVWQASFHDHIIRNQTDYLRIWNYIDGNPARWREDCFFPD